MALPDLIKTLRETIATEEPYSDSAINLGQSKVPVFTGYRIAEAIARIGADTDSSEAAAVLADALSAKSERTREGAINSLESLAPRSASRTRGSPGLSAQRPRRPSGRRIHSGKAETGQRPLGGVGTPRLGDPT